MCHESRSADPGTSGRGNDSQQLPGSHCLDGPLCRVDPDSCYSHDPRKSSQSEYSQNLRNPGGTDCQPVHCGKTGKSSSFQLAKRHRTGLHPRFHNFLPQRRFSFDRRNPVNAGLVSLLSILEVCRSLEGPARSAPAEQSATRITRRPQGRPQLCDFALPHSRRKRFRLAMSMAGP